jgi:hypothetical protein
LSAPAVSSLKDNVWFAKLANPAVFKLKFTVVLAIIIY